MAHRSQCSSAGDNPLDPNYLLPHYREEYRLAIDALVEEDLEGYYQFLQKADVVDFLAPPEIQYIQESIQLPQQSNNEQRFIETGGDGSSDTYWPIHSDLDAPGLDLGWPQMHHFIGPTEVTTLVNPPEPDMPSIKEQARRLIKNAKQVIAIVMDMFTDVDIFQDILNAAIRNVAVYIILDEQNADHFINMVSNCRVNLQSIQFIRVRTVSGMTYHCRSGKSFKGQMMDRFLLTDCRAVLSGNYSLMWSFEKIHRCMAHLFLGQLVSTFDEEFRILYAQSEPLMPENINMLPPMDDFNLLQKRQYPSERHLLYRDPRKFLPPEIAQSEEWGRNSYDERTDMDWRKMVPKRKDSLLGPANIYSRFPFQQSRLDPPFEQSSSRTPLMDNLAFKRHSYAEGVHGRYSFLSQQGIPEPDNQGRLPWQPYPGPGKEADYSSYDKSYNQDFYSLDQYSEPALQQEIEPPDNVDPVQNYLSSARNVDFDQGSDLLSAPAELPFSSSYPRRFSSGQTYACQKSPTPSTSTEQKLFFQEPNRDRKDPSVKQGLRDWRISSYLSTYDEKGDEGLSLVPPNVSETFEESPTPIQQTTSRIDLSTPKIPNVREFKVPAVPRASQIPSYAKNTIREQPKKLLDEPTSVVEETKGTPTPSESSSTTEGEKTEEAEQKEPITPLLHREDSFRRKYNAAVPRCSRLRSSLIFSSLDQQHSQDSKSAPGQNDEESDKSETETTKQPFISQVMGQRRSAAREPFEWSRYINKSATFDHSATESSKADKDSSKDDISDDPSGKHEAQEPLKPADIEQTQSSPSVPRSKPSEAELPKTNQSLQPTKSLLTDPLYTDMNDPDIRLMFFKQLAAKRKAAEAEKSKEKVTIKQPTDTKRSTPVKKAEPDPEEVTQKMAATTASTKVPEAEKGKEKVTIEQPTDTKCSTPVKKAEPDPEEVTQKMAATTASTEAPEAEKGKEKVTIKQPTALKRSNSFKSEEAGAKELIQKTPATRTSTTFEEFEMPKQKVRIKQPSDQKHSACVKKEEPDPEEMKQKMAATTTSTRASEAERGKEKVTIKQTTALKRSTSIKKEEPGLEEMTEKMAATTTSTKASEAERGKEKVTIKQTTALKRSTSIKKEEPGLEEMTEKMAATTTSITAAEIDRIKQKITTKKPTELKYSVFSEVAGANELIQKVAATTTSTKAEEVDKRKEVMVKQPTDTKHSTSNKKEPNPEEMTQTMTAATSTKAEEVKTSKEKVPIKSPTGLKQSTSTKKEEANPKEHTQRVAPTTSTKAEEVKKSKEKVLMKPPTELKNTIPVKKEEHDPKEMPEKLPTKEHTQRVAPTTSTKAEEGEKNKEKVLLTPTELENNNSVKREDPKETMDKKSVTTTSVKAAESDISKDKVHIKPVNLKNNTSVIKEERDPKETKTDATTTSEGLSGKNGCTEDVAKTVATETFKSSSQSLEACGEANKENSLGQIDPSSNQLASTLLVPAEPEAPYSKPVELLQSNPVVESSYPSCPPTQTNVPPNNIPSDECKNSCLTSTQNEPSLLAPSPVDVLSSSAFASLDTQNPDSAHSVNDTSCHHLLPEQHTGSEVTSNPSAPSSSFDQILPDSDSQLSPGHSPSHSSLFSTQVQIVPSNVTPVDSTVTSRTSFPSAQRTSSSFASPAQEKCVSQTESKSAQAQLDIVSKIPSSVDSGCEKSDGSLVTGVAGSESSKTTVQSLTKTDSEESGTCKLSEKDVPKSEINSVPLVSGKESEASEVLVGPPSINTLPPESCLPYLNDLETKSESDQNKTNSSVLPDLTASSSQTETAAPKDLPKRVMPPSELNLMRPVSDSRTEMSCSSQSESGERVLSPKAENILSPLHSPSNATSVPKQVTADSDKSPLLPSADPCSPDKPTSKVPAESDLPCKTPDAVISETHSSEPLVPTENNKTDSQNEDSHDPGIPDSEGKMNNADATLKINKSMTQESSLIEKTSDQIRQNNGSELQEITSGDLIPPSPQSRQPKSSQSRYHSSTANVISSSNLRDDTKLLLEQISANSQSRNEANKDAPVTDDEKEDKADKNAKREKARGFQSFNRDQPKSNQEREKLLERIQSMRKERKVYSRFEV